MGYVYVLSAEAWLRDRHMPLTRGERALLVTMLRAERASIASGYVNDLDDAYHDDELTFCRPGGWWLGLRPKSGAVCQSLVRRAYLSTQDRHDADYQTWVLNEDGRNAATAALAEIEKAQKPSGGGDAVD